MNINNIGFTLYKIVTFLVVFIISSFLLVKSTQNKLEAETETEKTNTEEYHQNKYSNNVYDGQDNYQSKNSEYYKDENPQYFEFSSYVIKDDRAYFYANPDFSVKRKAYLVINEIVYIQQIINGFGYAEFTNANGKTSKGWLLLKNIQYCSNCENTTVYNSTNNYEEQNTEVYENHSVNSKAEPYEGYQVFYQNFINKFNLPNVNRNVNEISVEVNFTIEKDGSFSNIYINGEDLYDMNEEIISVFSTMRKWKPAISEGEPVLSSFKMPLKIKL